MLILLLCVCLAVALGLLIGLNFKLNKHRDAELAKSAAQKAVAETLHRIR